VPARRRRILAGSPALIKRFQTYKSLRRKVTLTRIFASEGWELPSRYLSGSGRKSNRRVSTKAFAVTSANLTFVDSKNRLVRKMTPQELGRVQTFPSTYDWLADRNVAVKTIGNAIPPLIVGLLLGMTHVDAAQTGLGIGRGKRNDDEPVTDNGQDAAEEEEDVDSAGVSEEDVPRSNLKRPITTTQSPRGDTSTDDEEEEAELLSERRKRLKTNLAVAAPTAVVSLDLAVGVLVGCGKYATFGELKAALRSKFPLVEFTKEELKTAVVAAGNILEAMA